MGEWEEGGDDVGSAAAAEAKVGAAELRAGQQPGKIAARPRFCGARFLVEVAATSNVDNNVR